MINITKVVKACFENISIGLAAASFSMTGDVAIAEALNELHKLEKK